MPPHYAFSEALIVVSAIGAGWLLYRRGEGLAAAAVGLFGLAALIGAMRFGAGLQDTLAESHRLASQIGGLVGVLLLLLALSPRSGVAAPAWAGALLVVGSLAFAVITPIGGPLILLAASAIAVALLVIPKNTFVRRGTTILAFSAVAAVGTPLLAATGFGEATRWHLYHTVVALWIALLPFCLWRPQKSA